MEKSTQLKTVICGVALVALASVRPAQADPCVGFEGSGVCISHTFTGPGPTTAKYDYGTHAIKITVNVVNPFDLEVVFQHITDPDLDGRVITPLAPVDCIPYDGATSNTSLGTCGFYHIENPPDPGDYSGLVTYRVLWDFPTLDQLNDVRLYRAPLDNADNSCSQGFGCYTQDITDAVFATGDSNSDPGVRGDVPGFSDFEAVDLTSPTSTAARVWIGLKNSDDVGTRFDLKAVVSRDGLPVSSGALFGALGGSSGFNNAKLRTVPLSFPSTAFSSGDSISIEVSVRNSCLGSSHNSGTARLWYNDAAANSRVDEPVAGTLYLRQGTVLPLVLGVLGDGPATRKSLDVFVGARDLSCNGPYTPFGTWTGIVP
jgi:hypothetical protein